MKVLGYTRVSSDKQDLQKQEHLLLKYARQQDLRIQDFIKVRISSRRDNKARRIDELLANLDEGDVLLVAEFSRLGRNMFDWSTKLSCPKALAIFDLDKTTMTEKSISN